MADPALPTERLVRDGWNRASRLYRPDEAGADLFGHTFESYRGWLRSLLEELPRGAPVLDLGCGCGIPVARLLAERFRVTGVDLSDVQIARARSLVPEATFVLEDMTRLDLPPGSFAAVVCLYALIHVPLVAQRPLLTRIRRWLRTGGHLVLVTGHERYEGVEENWLGSGAPMFWSHADAATYREWLEAAGFRIVEQVFVPEGAGGHELFRATAR